MRIFGRNIGLGGGGLWLAVVLFLLTRGLTLTSFPIFNDEAIYLQYSQLIHDDWQKNQFISMNGQFQDWKPPLQYWITAPVIRWGTDPLVTGRIVASLVSLLGLFGFYLFARELFSQKEAVLAALLYVFCPPVLLHNNQFTAETFLFSTAPFCYWALLQSMRRPPRWNLGWIVLAVVLGTALLLFKQSGTLLLIMAMALPFAKIRRKDSESDMSPDTDQKSGPGAHWDWKGFGVNLSIAAAVILCAYLVARLIIPSEFNAAKDRFNSHWVMSLSEIIQFPIATWRGNVHVATEYIDSYYSWGIGIFFLGFLWLAIRQRNPTELVLAAMCLGSAAVIVFGLRGFNEYLLNTAVIVVLLPMLARTGVRIWHLKRDGKEGLVRRGTLALAGVVLIFWVYQLILIGVSPGKYIERSTDWAVANYLKGWPTGFGIKEVVAILGEEKKPGVVFTDTQWGNPTTALEVYAKDRFPNLRLVPISREFLDPAETRTLKEAARKLGQVRYVICSADTSDGRGEWLVNVEREMCETRTLVEAYPGQMPIIICRF